MEDLVLDTGLIITSTYLVSAALFILGLKLLGSPATARPIRLPLQNILSGALFLAIVSIIVYLVAVDASQPLFLGLIALCILLGVLLVIPIGGADMPVVISLLNSYSGLAAAAAGFVINNTILIIGGALVGAAGFILTRTMTTAMHRSLFNVIFSAFGAAASGSGGPAGAISDRPVRDGNAEDIGIMLAYARTVIVVPGYGLAVAQAQHQVRELADLLEARGVDVRYAIHPVAGRMPGHMNVLLAEADVPYDKLFDLDEINDSFERTDVAIVIGANDVTNPAARDTPESPIYGMPILNVDKAGQVVVLKRSLSPGFAGIDNDLFYNENTTMFFADAKQGLMRLIEAVQES